jgi:hypothetical protein
MTRARTLPRRSQELTKSRSRGRARRRSGFRDGSVSAPTRTGRRGDRCAAPAARGARLQPGGRRSGIHPAGGRWIAEHGTVPQLDPFTYSVPFTATSRTTGLPAGAPRLRAVAGVEGLVAPRFALLLVTGLLLLSVLRARGVSRRAASWHSARSFAAEWRSRRPEPELAPRRGDARRAREQAPMLLRLPLLLQIVWPTPTCTSSACAGGEPRSRRSRAAHAAHTARRRRPARARHVGTPMASKAPVALAARRGSAENASPSTSPACLPLAIAATQRSCSRRALSSAYRALFGLAASRCRCCVQTPRR